MRLYLVGNLFLESEKNIYPLQKPNGENIKSNGGIIVIKIKARTRKTNFCSKQWYDFYLTQFLYPVTANQCEETLGELRVIFNKRLPLWVITGKLELV